MRGFTQSDRFLSELESRKLKPAYVLVGDEAFFRKRFRRRETDAARRPCHKRYLSHQRAPFFINSRAMIMRWI